MSERLAAELMDVTHRVSRRAIELNASPGLYALFTKPGSELPAVQIPGDHLLYIGKGDGSGGLRARCHFKGGTRNHSPRKSLAVILEADLNLLPRPIINRDGSYKTWGLEKASEHSLDEWMHCNLEIAFATEPGAALLEKDLIRRFAPVLNLTDCSRSEAHRYLARLRLKMDERMRKLSVTGIF